jgi:phospholipid/cholesterol/gamma-HCH transport system substrate-binding protein
MVKETPTVGKLLVMVAFALSCFGLLLFLWLSFGGPVPLKSKGYQFKVAVPEAAQLGIEADVRTAGVTVGKVRDKELDPRGNRTLITVELDQRFAPLSRDARVILRQKTLLGETYVEITPGNPDGPTVPEDGELPRARVAEAVELDEIFSALDEPTRQAFQTWQQDLGKAVAGRGGELNDAFGTLPQFAADATDVLQVLDTHAGAVRGLVRNTGEVFAALTENEGQLRNLITNSADVFEATEREDRALAQTFRIFPTFLDESRATLAELERFSRNTRPLIRDLRPATRDLRPTLRDLRALAPDLRRFYLALDPLIDVSREGLPALSQTLRGARPLLGQLQPFLEQLNPILEWLEVHQHTVSDFFSNGASAIADTVPDQRFAFERGHYLGQFGLTGPESVANATQRQPAARGNAYLDAVALSGAERARRMMFPNWDCENTGRGAFTTEKRGSSDLPSCWTKPPPGKTQFPQIGAADYSAGG